MKNFIPKPYRKEPVTVRIDVDKLARIDRLIAQYGLNRSELINRCIDYGLDHMPEANLGQEEDATPLK
jgi:metal-responsive CopG/Arc/MetJ family transcriptional regulator